MSVILSKLRYTRLKGYVFFGQGTDQVFFDRNSSKTYLIGFSRVLKEIVPPHARSPITINSIDMQAFGMGWDPV